MDKYKKVIVIEIANNVIRCGFEFEKTASFFSEFTKEKEIKCDNIVTIDDYDRQLWNRTGNILDSYGEYSLLCGGVSDYLLQYNCCLIHGVAFRYKEKAFLIIGPSGAGKSTQIKFLMDLYPGEFSVICGDRPCLKFNDDHSIFVFPTPWNGKENFRGGSATELAGVFFLKRGEQTDITLVSKNEAIYPIFSSLISRREKESDVLNLAMLTEKLLTNYPVYRYVNGGVPSSSVYFYDKIKKGVF